MFRKIFIPVLICFTTVSFAQKSAYKMLVGTYTNNGISEGIYNLEFNKKGKLVSKELVAKSDNPSYLAFSPDQNYVYAVNETGNTSAVSSFAFNKNKKTLTLINKKETFGADACYIIATNKHVFTANYSGGSLSVFGRNTDGSITDTLEVIKHPRKVFAPNRFGPSNAHQILFSPNGKLVVATNLGTDRVFSYAYKPVNGKKVLEYIDEIAVKRGSGPRHTVFSKDGKFLYLVQELDASITVFSVAEDGKLTILQETTLVTDNAKKNGAADIHLSPDGKFLYATNRGEANTITCFAVKKDGTVSFVEQYSTYGNAPRNFTVSSDGKFIFVGNQKTNNITVFSRNKKSGKLQKTDENVELGAPVCLLLY